MRVAKIRECAWFVLSSHPILSIFFLASRSMEIQSIPRKDLDFIFFTLKKWSGIVFCSAFDWCIAPRLFSKTQILFIKKLKKELFKILLNYGKHVQSRSGSLGAKIFQPRIVIRTAKEIFMVFSGPFVLGKLLLGISRLETVEWKHFSGLLF